jgi:hypothetical protein
MPAKYDRCVKEVSKQIKKGKTKKYYINKEGKRVKSNPHAICAKLRKPKKKGGK